MSRRSVAPVPWPPPPLTALRPRSADRGGLSLANVAEHRSERSIGITEATLAEDPRGTTAVPELSLAQIQDKLDRSVDRVMAEGSLYDPHLAALAIKQAQGDII